MTNAPASTRPVARCASCGAPAPDAVVWRIDADVETVALCARCEAEEIAAVEADDG